MASLIPGFEYDVFISYRQKDNLPSPGYGRQGGGDRWVSEFVEALKTELESTFKEEISVYFDINPHDGLLETHDVDASLKDKLKCLIFIPIISRTYCDLKSFAWEHEFKAFVEDATKDQFGLKVKLPNGNVANRVLPIRIHDLDNDDIRLCESVLGGILRGVEFIYKEPGINKPLSPEDDEKKNLNRTKYRLQINKTANAIKEIISGLKKEPTESISESKEATLIEGKPIIKEKSIIVLPFENISPDPEQEYFSDGLTEEIITDLSHINDLLVISRSSAMTFKGTKKTIAEIVQAVNVRYVLEGSVRKAGNNLRITAQLIDANNDVHIWAEKFSGTIVDVFDIQEKVSHSITEALKLKLGPDEHRQLINQGTKSIKAYELCLRSLHYRNLFTPKGLKRAIEYLELALIEDPDYAPAHGELAMCYWGLGNLGYMPPREAYTHLKTTATKALKIDDSLAEAHMALGFYNQDVEWDWAAAEKEFKRAIYLKPGDSWFHMGYSWLLAIVHRHEESIIEMRRALELDPLSPSAAACVGEVLMMARENDKAIDQCQSVMALDSTWCFTYWVLGMAYQQKGQFQESVEAFEKSAILLERDPVALSMLGYSLGIIDRTNEAREILNELLSRQKQIYVSQFWIATVCLGLGEINKALDLLQEGYEKRDSYMHMINAYVQFDILHNDPRYQDLCQKMNLI
jgi:TolB-like protein/Flp pilus assembly protein TadD